MKAIDPGDYPHWLSFGRIIESKDGLGGSTDSFPIVFSSWGAQEPLGGSEFPEYQKRHQKTTMRFRIPYRSDVPVGDYAAKYRIEHGGQIWDIHLAVVMPAGIPVEVHIEASETK